MAVCTSFQIIIQYEIGFRNQDEEYSIRRSGGLFLEEDDLLKVSDSFNDEYQGDPIPSDIHRA